MKRAFVRAVLLLAVGGALTLAGCVSATDRPAADFSWCPDGSAGELDYVFTASCGLASGHGIVRAVWEFDDGTPPREGLGPVTHRFPSAGAYDVTLTLTDERGVAGTETRRLNVELAWYIDSTWRLFLDYPPAVHGVVGNRSANRLSAVVVRVRFYDVDGVRVSEGRRTVTDLEPAERARFTIEATESPERVYCAAVEVESFSADCAADAPSGR